MKYVMAARSATTPSVEPTDAAMMTGVEIGAFEDDGEGNPAASSADSAN